MDLLDMDRHQQAAALREWSRPFAASAHYLYQAPLGVFWFLMGVDPWEAAKWANQGYVPGEAAPLLAAGYTAATLWKVNRHAEQRASADYRGAYQHIIQGIARGHFINPAHAILAEDPDRPDCQMITLRDD